MIIFLLVALAAAVAAWVFVPEFRAFIDGWKTRIAGWLTVLMGVVEVIDKQLLSQALGLDAQGKAWLFVGLAAAIVLFREMAKKPGALGRPK